MTVRRLSQPLVVFAAAGCVVAGVALLVMAAVPSRASGWFAYAPLQGAGPANFVIVPNWQQYLGVGLIVAGLVATAGIVGYRFGRSRGA